MVMLKRTLFFGSPGRLFLEHSLLAYETRNANDASEKRTFPLEDLGFIVLESLQLAVTTACLNALAKENIAVVVCDHAHMPSAMLQPFSGNTLAQRHTEAQLRATEALKARLWRQTVKAKITNQAECLKRLGLPDRRLRVLAESVKAGDSDNAEAVAARYYFQQLAEPEAFSRCRDGIPPNPALNYGYAILRTAVARALTGSGLLCVAGIHHSNQYNPFGLADDIMEPFRPFVDEMVFSSRDFFAVPELGKVQKAQLLQLLTADVISGTERRPLLNSISCTSASLVRCFLREETVVKYPEFVKK
jgi:CRISPR-associated endonuclease cas1, NMENI subtype